MQNRWFFLYSSPIFNVFPMLDLLYYAISEIQFLFSQNPTGQIFGFIAMFIGITGFMVKNDKTTVKIFIVSCIFWIIHFIFLENYGALTATFIGLVRLVLSLKYQKSVSIFLWIIAVSFAYGIYSFDGRIISILPLIATAVSSYGFFFLEKIRLRLLLIFVSLMWLVYHLSTGSISGIINEIFVQITVWYSVILFVTRREKKQKVLERLKRKIGRAPARLNFWRYIFMRDKDRFD